MRIPIDRKAMKHIDDKWPKKFKDEPWSIILGLEMDGVNPFLNQTSTHTCWPIVIINYNIPPWISTRKEHLMLVVIVLGLKQVKHMDVYLKLVIDELRLLWKGFQMYDISRPINQM